MVYRFKGPPDGAFVYNGMVADSTGTVLYGATVHGGTAKLIGQARRPVLLVAQGCKWIYSGGAARGDPTGQKRDGGQE